MTVLATIGIAADAFALGEVLSGHDTRIQLTQFVPIDSDLIPYFWADNHDLDAFEAAVRADPRVTDLTVLDRGVQQTLYALDWSDEMDGLFAALRAPPIILDKATGTGEHWLIVLRAPDRSVLEDVQAALRAADIPLTVHRVAHNPDGLERASDTLTEKQHEAVLVALREGYFAVPREISLTELAEKVGISRQAYTRRLQRGLRGILTDTFAAHDRTDETD